MPRPPKVIPNVPTRLYLPADVMAQVQVQLFSELEGRVPQGALAGLVERLLRKWLAEQHRAADGFGFPAART